MKYFILVILFFSKIAIAKSINIYDPQNLLTNQDNRRILSVTNDVLKIFQIKNLKLDLNINIKRGSHHSSVYHSNTKDLSIYISDKLYLDIYAHELTHHIIMNYYNKNKLINNYLLKEALPDIIGQEFDTPRSSICDENYDRLNYNFSYKDDIKFFNPFFYLKQAHMCCEHIRNKESSFCRNLEHKSQWYSLEYEAKHNKGRAYPLHKDLTGPHYIGLPLIFYFKDYKNKNNLNNKQLFKLILNSNKQNILEFIKNQTYDKNLFNKYHLEKLKELI